MHNRGLQDEIIKSIDAWLADQCLSCDNLDASKLREYSATRGWQLQVVVQQTVVDIDLLLPEGWPYDPPDFYLVDKSYYLVWPHVEENGRLCLKHGSTVEISPYRPLNVIQIFFGEMLSLLGQLTTHQLDDDFYDEFETYWALGVSANAQPIYSILSSGFETGKIAVWRGRSFSVIGENASQLNSWMNNRFNITPKEYVSGFLAKLQRRLLPAEFPKTTRELRSVLERYCSGFDDSMLHWVLDEVREGFVVLATEAEGEAAFVGVEVYQNASKRLSTRRSARQTYVRVPGFRDGKCPKSIEVNTLISNSRLIPAKVARADAAWIHGGRGRDYRFQILQKQSVLLIGAGSLGSFVANGLAQAGIGRMKIIDNDPLSWANTGRHFLGAEYVGSNKAVAMATKLLKSYPSMQSCRAADTRWEEAIREDVTSFDEYDLIVSLTGSWRSESLLNNWVLHNRTDRQILYGWLEPFASAGHAVSIAKAGGCLQCGFSETGRPRRQVFEWPQLESTMLKEGGCGSFFQPYGISETLHTIAMITEMAIELLLSPLEHSSHRIWVRNEGPLENTGRQWTQAWLDSPETTNELDRVYRFSWPQRIDCPRCAK